MILVALILVFHVGYGTASATIYFPDMAACETAKTNAHNEPGGDYIYGAYCIPNAIVPLR